MTSKDLISVFMPIFGLILIIVILILVRRYKLKPETWPYIASIGSGVYLYVPLMIESIMNRPQTQLLNYTITNLIFSLVISIVIYFMFRMIVVNIEKKRIKK